MQIIQIMKIYAETFLYEAFQLITQHFIMEQNFEIQNGDITFFEKEIVIADNYIQQNIFYVVPNFLTIVYSLLLISSYRMTGQQLSLWWGIILLLLGIYNTIFMTFFRSRKKHIQNREVVSMVIKKNSRILNIKLNNGKLRQLLLNKDVHEDLITIIGTFN